MNQDHIGERLDRKRKQEEPPRGGKKQGGSQKTGAQSNMAHSIKDTRMTTDQHRTADTRRLNRETNEGDEADTGGATETMIR